MKTHSYQYQNGTGVFKITTLVHLLKAQKLYPKISIFIWLGMKIYAHSNSKNSTNQANNSSMKYISSNITTTMETSFECMKSTSHTSKHSHIKYKAMN